MSDRMDKIHEYAEEARQWDIEVGRQLERERVLSLLRALESLIVKGK